MKKLKAKKKTMLGAGLAAESSHAGRAVTSLLQRMSKTGDPIAQDCFKLLATLMRKSTVYQASNAQLRYLLTWAFSDMEQAAGRQAAFGLLKVRLPGQVLPCEVQACLVNGQACLFQPALLMGRPAFLKPALLMGQACLSQACLFKPA